VDEGELKRKEKLPASGSGHSKAVDQPNSIGDNPAPKSLTFTDPLVVLGCNMK
jgi:hypothetical protein